jgi:hypothetical protein
VRRCASAVAIACALGSLAAIGCASSYYDEYRAEHPGFDAHLPRVGASLPELLAALHAPDRVETIEAELVRLAIFEVREERWREIPFEAIRSGSFAPSDASDYAVLVGLRCRFEQGLDESGTTRAGYYLLPDNRVAAYDHYAFRDRCAVINEFLAARGALVPMEREAFARLAGYGSRMTLAQAYRRGLAYLEAGRLSDAQAMLVLGERSYRASAASMRASGRSEGLADAERMREALMRALGVEAADPPSP